MRKGILLATFALSACAAAPPPAEIPHHDAGDCRSEGLGRFVGRPASQELGAEMLRDSGARTIRWVAYGMAVTMDFSPQRLTVQLTPDGKVERANCG